MEVKNAIRIGIKNPLLSNQYEETPKRNKLLNPSYTDKSEDKVESKLTTSPGNTISVKDEEKPNFVNEYNKKSMNVIKQEENIENSETHKKLSEEVMNNVIQIEGVKKILKEPMEEEKKSKNTAKDTKSTRKSSRLITNKIPQKLSQSVAFKFSDQRASSTVLSPSMEDMSSSMKMNIPAFTPRMITNEYGTCTNFKNNILEVSHVSIISIEKTYTPILRSPINEHKTQISEKYNDNFIINKENYKEYIKESARRNMEGHTLSWFKQRFNDRLDNINNAITRRHLSEIEFHENMIRYAPEPISKSRVRLCHEWAKDSIRRREEAFYVI